MLKLIAAFALTLFLPLAASAHPVGAAKAQNKAKVEEIIAFRASIIKAVEAKDVAKLREIYSDEFVHTHTSAKMDGKDQRIVSLLAGEPVIETAPSSNIVIRISHDAYTGIATGVSPIKSTADGKTYAVHWTAIYTNGAGGWQLAASHATRGPEMKP